MRRTMYQQFKGVHHHYRINPLKVCFIIFLLLFSSIDLFSQQSQNPWNRRVILQGFWWDYENYNYPDGWANYLTDLSPRLKEIGIDAIWIPPAVKNRERVVGYAPFDNYDLGDKFQKGAARTRLGTKDELLRMIAVMNSNGIGIIHDVVLNHIIGAGSEAGGLGGEDPLTPTTDKFKNFRYTSYATPATDNSANDYLSRSGRFSKNWTNFHPNQWRSFGGNSGSAQNNITSALFGPDICYDSRAWGQSSNALFNPSQSADYMRNETRRWVTWYVKQTDAKGFRFDAVKHFEPQIIHDILFNVYNTSGLIGDMAIGDTVISVGEWVGSKSEIDNWAGAAPNGLSIPTLSSTSWNLGGVENRAGTFDFGLRGFDDGLVGMVYGFGNFDLARLPGLQQDNRFRTVPFVNNHDTFRPPLQANGNYPQDSLGNTRTWTSGSELARNIDPREPRLAAAYAVMMAVDGAPQVFFEDLFDIGQYGNRYTHNPKDTSRGTTTGLPVRLDIANIIRFHQKFNLKLGGYFVRTAEPNIGNSGAFFPSGNSASNMLVIERGNRGIIAVNDRFDNSQEVWIDSQFPAGTVLKDYSGNFPNTVVQGDSRVNIKAPSCSGPVGQTTLNRGYALWARASDSAFFYAPFSNSERATRHEWEMADDLGDSHGMSLQQGGMLPNKSTAWRNVGNIFASAGKAVQVQLLPSLSGRPTKLSLFNGTTEVAADSGTTSLTLNYVPVSTDYLTIRVKNMSDTNSSQVVNVRATYTAPSDITTANEPKVAYNPGIFKAIKIGARSVQLTWDGVSSEFRVLRKIGSAPNSPDDPLAFLIADGVTAGNTTVSNLQTGFTHYFAVYGKAGNKFSFLSLIDSAFVEGAQAVITPRSIRLDTAALQFDFDSEGFGSENNISMFFTWDTSTIYLGLLGGSPLVGTSQNVWIVADNLKGGGNASQPVNPARSSGKPLDGGGATYKAPFVPNVAFTFFGTGSPDTSVQAPAAGEKFVSLSGVWSKTNSGFTHAQGVRAVRRGGSDLSVISIPFSELNTSLGDSLRIMVYVTSNEFVNPPNNTNRAQWPTQNPNGSNPLLDSYYQFKLEIGAEPNKYPILPEDRTASAGREQRSTPESFILKQNYPNPFNPTTTIRYGLPAAAEIRLEVFDLLGRKVATLVNERQSAGYYTVPFESQRFQLSSGLYLYRLTSNGVMQSKKMLLLK
ncbi:MAG: alpha-amylase family glycosyl hydrolase [Chloroherpetonaceae bacterium]|nr:alpha-amylase family glycosyl hydrolase [Chloroherpetonaceae bacterium]